MKRLKLTFILAITAFAIFSCENKESKKETSDSTAIQTPDTTTQSATDTAATGLGMTYTIDTAASIIKWTGKKVTGKHNGKIKIQSGQLMAQNNALTGGTIVIDMASMTNDDLTKKEENQKLVGHLKSEDFFAVEKYPTATFTIVRVDAGKSADEAIVTGKLELKGKSEEISIPAKIKVDETSVDATGKTSIDRTKWDIQYGSGKFFKGLGDKMIYDDIELEVELKGKK